MKVSKFEARIYAGIALVVMAFLPIIFSTVYALRKVIQQEAMTIERYASTMILTERVRVAAESEFALVPAFVLSGNREILSAFDRARVSFLTDLRALSVQSTEPGPVAEMDALRTIEAGMYQIAEPGFEMRESGASIGEVNEYFQKAQALTKNFIEQMDKFERNQSDKFEEAKAKVAQDMNEMIRLLLMVTIAGTGVAAFAIAWLVRALQIKRRGDESREEQLVQEQKISKARKETVEIVSHDLKNPLSTIMMSLELIDEEPSLTETVKHDIQIARRSARSMQGLIRDLLDRAKYEAGQFDLDLAECEVAPLLNAIKTGFEVPAQSKHIELSVETTIDGLVCDCARIEQVISNLMGNAIKFTPYGGRVRLSARHENGETIFSVSDSGPGIPPAQIQKIFERFWQSKETANLGTGLGLAIARSIVDAHGGRIWAESEPGQGASFHFSIPAHPGRPNAKTTAEQLLTRVEL